MIGRVLEVMLPGLFFCWNEDQFRVSYDPFRSATEGLWIDSVMVSFSVIEGPVPAFSAGAEQNGVELN